MKRKLFTTFLCAFAVYCSAQDSLSVTAIKEYPLLWQQTSAEYRALCYQAFNTAELRLNQIPHKKFKKSHLAIITDLDETILNNSYFDAQLIKDGAKYSNEAWKKWTSRSLATAVPGAVEFLQKAKQKGVTIFYVSNRDTADVNHTLAVMQRLQLPDADSDHCLFMSTTSSKETRRKTIEKDYEVVMLLGDNLNDFTDAFEKKTIQERFAETDKVKDEWGKKFIVLPNADYGEWENAIYNYQHKLSDKEKEALRRELLQGYE